ncbi:ANL family adenylate-forming protein [Thermotalea metallivorans]|uniref:Long-chain-fatty-acid--CoA ligase n=1 Tax=Thermotalea metallivorans TaxID=520762 RepID=A0A140L4I1_9FIRM|nr:fatty acid--CoA ligase family protein [Thermotalea metallivorans]KXG75456.1 Long-chain-fatty-acid--CoA ligase FadD13 [Thermotalea metallivorans]
MNLFFVDEKRNIFKTYDDLIKDLNGKDRIREKIYFENPYDIFKELIYSMAMGSPVELIDSDFSKREIENLPMDYDEIFKEKPATKLDIKDFHDLIKRINKNKKSWGLALYTSGTTGRPKRIVHTLDTVARSVKVCEEMRKKIWVLAYNPTHFAGLQVFFQAFFNRNPMIYVFDQDRKKIEPILQKYKVTHISATPTFYRTFIPLVENSILSVEVATFGGEKFDPNLEEKLKGIFPNAKIRNIYASTEGGSLFGAAGEVFEIKKNMEHLVRISEEKELLIHKSLLAPSTEYFLVDDWYPTGDIVEVVGENKFKFTTRKTEMVNVGGYKINPHEVEEEIMKIDGVIDVLVKGRKNSAVGNILVAEVVKNDEETEEEMIKKIYEVLSFKLQKWKIPGTIVFCAEIPKTRTGKKVRT